MQRTTWVEEQVAKLCEAPLTAETVFLRAAYREKDGIEKEVCDLILGLAGEGIIVSMKAQEDPAGRVVEKMRRWCGKASRKAALQLSGAIRRLRSTPCGCHHRRRGRVDFGVGEIQVRHAIAVVEALTSVVTLPSDLPDGKEDIPFAYFSMNDFLNLIHELRAFPDLITYLDARSRLPSAMRTILGDERVKYEYYLLNQDTFDGAVDRAGMQATVKARAAELERLLEDKEALDRYASLIEHVSDALSTRAPDYAIGLDAKALAGYDPDDQRRQYLLLQENLCDLGLAARRGLGEGLWTAVRAVASSPEPSALTYAAFFVDAKPDFLYVPMAAKGMKRPDILQRAQNALLGGLAYYQKRRGMAIVDRDGEGYEVALVQPESHTAEAKELGKRLFGTLAVTDTPATLSPATLHKDTHATN